jgi:PAS domain S-box-containing protein
MRSNSERAKDQWFDKNQQISNFLKSAAEYFQDNEDRKILGKMIESHESILEIFSALVANREKNYLNAGLVGLPLDVEERLLNQLNMRVYEQVLKGRALQESSRKALASALKMAVGGVVLALLVIIVAALINLRSMGRVITDRINLLRNGAAVIGGGNLDHLIDIKGDDEFAELSAAFNAMTAKLSGSYHDLNTEIEERKQSEEALRLTQESIDGASEMVAWFTPEGRIHYINGATCQTLGYSRDELFRMTALDFSPGFTWEQYREHWQEVRERKSFTLETTHRRKDGSEYPAEVLVNYAFYGGKEYIFAYGRDITERKKAEERIKASLAEKEVMLKEIHHRVKNNLQVISSLVSLQADNMTDKLMREEFDDICDRVRSMALIHEKLYQTDDLARLNFADYVASLLHSLWNSHDVLAEKVRLNLELTPVTLTIETAVPCGLILNELAGNALKHAFPNGSDGEVTVGLENDATTSTACLWVRDNGVGLSPDLDWRQTSSLGLRLVQILTGQLRGTVETVVIGTGTEFRVTFPFNGSQS